MGYFCGKSLLKMKVVIIGFGGMGKRHGKDMEELSKGQIEIAGVFDPDDRSYEFGCKWMGKAPRRFRAIGEMLDTVRPDGAIISSPNGTHLLSLREFAGRNIPIILEKPLETSMAKVVEVVRFVETYPALVMVHHVMRYSPIVLKAKEIVDAGEICSFELVQNMGGGHMYQDFRRTFKTGGGQLMEKATHDFDVLLFLTGTRPKRVASICKRQYYGGAKPDTLRCGVCDERSHCRHAVVSTPAGTDVLAACIVCGPAETYNLLLLNESKGNITL
jgi:predicted dehydrogenase